VLTVGLLWLGPLGVLGSVVDALNGDGGTPVNAAPTVTATPTDVPVSGPVLVTPERVEFTPAPPPEPTEEPTAIPTPEPTAEPTEEPTATPSPSPTAPPSPTVSTTPPADVTPEGTPD
jgi:cell division septation protein DedD